MWRADGKMNKKCVSVGMYLVKTVDRGRCCIRVSNFHWIYGYFLLPLILMSLVETCVSLTPVLGYAAKCYCKTLDVWYSSHPVFFILHAHTEKKEKYPKWFYLLFSVWNALFWRSLRVKFCLVRWYPGELKRSTVEFWLYAGTRPVYHYRLSYL